MKTHFRLVLVLLAFAGMAGLAAAQPFDQPLPPCYHRLDQVYNYIFNLQTQYPGVVRVDSIGHSRGDMLGHQYPIYAVKISDNVDTFEDEPVMLVICHIHAEEVVGLEMCLDYMTKLASGQLSYPLLNSAQMYFIPTMNPDGLQVISYGVPSGNDTLWDNTWRKNGYRPPELGLASCNVVPGSGGDSCGVDLNRNFDINWIYGDPLWAGASCQPYDYFRGPAPFSEPEDLCVANFAMQIKPALSIVYHASRGCNHDETIAEQTIVAWQWGYDPGPYKFPPDCTAISLIGRTFGSMLHGTLHNPYLYVWGGTHNGCLQDWFYQQLGCIQVLTELGPPYDIQPACPTLTQLINEDRASLEWMHRRLTNLNIDQPKVLNIYTTDASTGSPISAEWHILHNGTSSPVLGHWMTNEQYGRATFFPPLGQTTIQARKEGYVTKDTTVTISPNGSRMAPLRLQPLPWYALSLVMHNGNGDPISGNVFVDGEFPKWLAVPAGGMTRNLPQGSYRLMFVPDDAGLSVIWRNVDLSGAATVDAWCPTATATLIDNFEGGLTNWPHGGIGDNWRVDQDTTGFGYGQSLCTTVASCPPHLQCVYPNNADTWIRYNNPLFAGGVNNHVVLQFDRRGRMDVPADSFFVEVSTDGASWQKAAGYSDMDVNWTPTWVNLDWLAGTSFQLRFRLQSDAALGETGMHIDNVRLMAALDTGADEPRPPVIYSYRIASAYPNPFNPSTTIVYEVAAAGAVTFDVYNVSGQIVRHFDVEAPSPGQYRLVWNGANDAGVNLSSGLYFLQMHAKQHSSMQKLLLLR